MKKCNRCNIEKDDSEFGLHTERYKTNVYLVLRSNCKKCESELSKEYYNSHKNDEEFKKKNRERAKNYKNLNYDKVKARKETVDFKRKHAELNMKSYIKMKDVISAKMKLKRQTQEYKNKMRKYRELNKKKIYQQEKITKKKYHEKHKNEITDRYAIRQLVSQGMGTFDEIKGDKDLIDSEKIKILTHRIKDLICKREPEIGIKKKCSICLEEKDLSCFYKMKNNKRCYCCKDCSSKKCKQYRLLKKQQNENNTNTSEPLI